MATLPPVPHKAPMTDQNGVASPVWSDWFKKVFVRAGGHSASTNLELDSDVTAINTSISTINSTITALTPRLVPAGTVLMHAGASAPTGYLLCDGSAKSRTIYADLFTAIGTTWGVGDGSTTFNLPPEGIFPVNKAAAGTFATLAASGGAESTTLPNHAHSVSITSGGPSGTANVTAGGVAVAYSAHTHGVSGNTGDPTTNPTIATLPPFRVFNFVIKT